MRYHSIRNVIRSVIAASLVTTGGATGMASPGLQSISLNHACFINDFEPPIHPNPCYPRWDCQLDSWLASVDDSLLECELIAERYEHRTKISQFLNHNLPKLTKNNLFREFEKGFGWIQTISISPRAWLEVSQRSILDLSALVGRHSQTEPASQTQANLFVFIFDYPETTQSDSREQRDENIVETLASEGAIVIAGSAHDEAIASIAEGTGTHLVAIQAAPFLSSVHESCFADCQIAPVMQSASSDTDSAYRDELAAETEPNIDGEASVANDVATLADEVVYGANDVASATPEVVPVADNLLSVAEDAAPVAEDVAPVADDLVSVADDLAPVLDDVAAVAADVASPADELPISEDTESSDRPPTLANVDCADPHGTGHCLIQTQDDLVNASEQLFRADDSRDRLDYWIEYPWNMRSWHFRTHPVPSGIPFIPSLSKKIIPDHESILGLRKSNIITEIPLDPNLEMTFRSGERISIEPEKQHRAWESMEQISEETLAIVKPWLTNTLSIARKNIDTHLTPWSTLLRFTTRQSTLITAQSLKSLGNFLLESANRIEAGDIQAAVAGRTIPNR